MTKLDAYLDGLVKLVEQWAEDNKDTDPTAAEVYAILNEDNLTQESDDERSN